MERGFWKKLRKPIFALAPMANVTDTAFRRLIARHGKSGVMWTEFVSADGLCSAGKRALLPDLAFSPAERPIVAQFFGANPDHFYQVAKLARKLGFDGVDINMGCPDRAVVRQGAGAALMKNPELAKRIILAAKQGAGPLPVSVKTRIGDRANTLKEWIPELLEAEPAALIFHARTWKDLSLVPARWDAIREAVRIVRKRSDRKNRPLVLGNGDVSSLPEARARVRETGADGVMIGRGVFGNPWFFNSRRRRAPDRSERLAALSEHIQLFNRLLGKKKNFDVMKKHFKAYVSGFNGAKELRIALMDTDDAATALGLIRRFRGRD